MVAVSERILHGPVTPFRTELPVSLECIGCGHRMEAVTYTRLRRIYEEHVPTCPHDRSRYNGWHGEALG